MIEAITKDQPTGRNSRRIWFFYEWLTDDKIDVEDVQSGNYVEALDRDLQYPGPKDFKALTDDKMSMLEEECQDIFKK